MEAIPVWDIESLAYTAGPGRTTADLIRQQAHRDPEGFAVGDSEKWLSWRAVTEQSDLVALGLLEQGFGRGNIALVQVGNCLDGYIARLALEKAGIQALNLPSTYREREISALMRRLRPALAIVRTTVHGYALAQTVAQLGEGTPGFRKLFTLEIGEQFQPMSSLAKVQSERGSEYLLERYQFRWLEGSQIATTSGSTGDPKCVEATIGGRMLTGLEQARLFNIGGDDVIAALGPIISGTPEALGYRAAPFLGARLFLVDDMEPSQIIVNLALHHVTVAVLVPTILVRLVREPDFNHFMLPDLRVIVSYGATLPVQAAKAGECQTNARVVQAYGSVDFGGISATPVDASQQVRLFTVGTPLRGDEVRILDENGEEQPRGQVGYVSVRGIHATARYMGPIALAQEHWRYGFDRVGEFGYFDAEDHLVLVGRASDLIIRGGQNIAAAEVEHWLREHPNILDAAVLGVPDDEMGERVGAVICLREAETLTLEELQAFFREKGVALFKCPEYVDVVEEMPTGTTGLKIDKNALRERLLAAIDRR